MQTCVYAGVYKPSGIFARARHSLLTLEYVEDACRYAVRRLSGVSVDQFAGTSMPKCRNDSGYGLSQCFVQKKKKIHTRIDVATYPDNSRLTLN